MLYPTNWRRVSFIVLLAVIIAGCDTTEPPGIIPEELEGTWASVDAGVAAETIVFRATKNGYRFEVRQGAEVVTRGSFATVGVGGVDSAFEIRVTVHVDESVVDGRLDERAAFRGDDTLILTKANEGATDREFRRVE